MKQTIFSEHLAVASAMQEQADQFTGASDTTGLFFIPFSSRLLGVYAKSDAGSTLDWVVSIGLPVPGTSDLSYYDIAGGTGPSITNATANLPDLPAGSRVRITTTAVTNANLKAQIVTAILQEPF